EQNDSSKCLPCKEDEYIEYPNDFPKCLGCRTCREDQVELSSCRAISDTRCACRNGTFCSPDHPCEMCQKCRPRCSKDEVELAPCTPDSDRQCRPATGTFSDSSGNWPTVSAWRWQGVSCAGSGFRTAKSARCSWLPRVLCRFSADAEQTHSSSLPGQDPGGSSPLLVGAVIPKLGNDGCPGVGVGISCPQQLLERGRGSPAPPLMGPGDSIFLRRSFDIFARDVPCKDWKRYGRALDLLENDITLAEMNDKYSLEPFFQMLNTWQNRQGMNASVNTLLETLHEINLGGIAEDISSKLVQQGSFQYEVS
ncbi:TR10B factor, partial [Nyctibius bracteatus]|nr:TR10B factor [Nyctibius bracteatus]